MEYTCMREEKRAILVVSFGTSHNDTCARTIAVIEEQIREEYPQYPLYRAWTSGKIRRKIEKRDGIHIFSILEAMEQMKADGIKEVIVQPTHVLNAIENEEMLAQIEKAESLFSRVSVGAPLIATRQDQEKVAELMTEAWNIHEDEMLVFMGHGTEHHANEVYEGLNEQFKYRNREDMLLGTVEGFPAISDVVEAVKKRNPEKVILAPFMIVAGDHAKNDLAGEEEDSWKSILEKEGYEVECVLKGLGEYEGVRQIFLEHLQDAMNEIRQ